MKRDRIAYFLAFTVLMTCSTASYAEDQNQASSTPSEAAGITALAATVTGTHLFVRTVRRSNQIGTRIYSNEVQIKNLTKKQPEKIKALELENKALNKDINRSIVKLTGSIVALTSTPFMVDAIVQGHQVSKNLDKSQTSSESNSNETSAPQTATAHAAQ